MAAKKGAKKAARQAKPSEEDRAAQQGSDRLTGAVYHGGRMYDHRKAVDQRAFAALVEKEERNSDKDAKKKLEAHLQRLRDDGALVGYGTKATSKKARAEEAGEDTGDSTETLDEKEAREQAQEDEE